MIQLAFKCLFKKSSVRHKDWMAGEETRTFGMLSDPRAGFHISGRPIRFSRKIKMLLILKFPSKKQKPSCLLLPLFSSPVSSSLASMLLLAKFSSFNNGFLSPANLSSLQIWKVHVLKRQIVPKQKRKQRQMNPEWFSPVFGEISWHLHKVNVNTNSP